MKASWFIFLILVILLFECCASFKGTSFKKELSQTGDRNDAIQNAIMDFTNNRSLYKKDSVFFISFFDTLHKMVLEKIDDRNYRWIKGEIYEEIVAVSIAASYNQFLLTADTKVGSKGKLPTRYIEKNGKLFFWWDNEYPLTEKTLAVFSKYNLLQDDEGGIIKFPDFIIDDAQKGADYYFCKNNLTKYKKVITNIGIGYYDIPNLKCSE